jgi:phosphoserine phosphatase RsbU/P
VQVESERRWLLLALAVDTLIAALDLALGRNTILVGLLIVGPLLASARLGPGLTALAGGYAVALSFVVGLAGPVISVQDHLLRCLTVLAGSGFATLTAHLRSQREQALLRMTQVAEVTQRAILRPIPARIGGVAFATRYQSASQEALIGGDLYDAAFTPFGLRTIMGDVKGKGLEGVRLAAAVLSYFREAAFAEPDLLWVVADLDSRLAAELGPEDFVTVVLAEFGTDEVRLVNCGHHPPLRVGDRLEPLAGDVVAPPLGLEPRPKMARFPLGPGERVLFYTDGLVEARDATGRMFPLDESVRAVLAGPSLQEALDELVERVLRHTGGSMDDDLALVLGECHLEKREPLTGTVAASERS